ncbi:MAG: energy transducer TonB [Alphaproteobacteria bacterium]|nr:energy transducer TonB [Alphaproteobacteria bacterium]
MILENPISQPPPIYPQAAYEADVEGFVTVEVVLRPDGTVLNATVLKAEPPGWGFEEAALGAVRKWRYMSSGREVRFETIVEFKIPPEFRVPPVPIDRKSD